MACQESLLRDIKPFALLDDEDRAALAQVVDLCRAEPGQVMFRAGDPGESLYVVASGEVELFLEDNLGQKILVAVAGPGDLFGELALLDDGSRTATAMARSACELIEVARGDLLQLVRRHPGAAIALLAAMAAMTRRADEALRTRGVPNVNDAMDEQLTTLQRIADWIAWFSGSMSFLMLNGVFFAVWIAINTLDLGVRRFDPFPFGLLTMIVSLEAIFLSCFVLISQNRQAEKDHVRSDVEYEINVRAEREVAHLHAKADRIYEQMMARFRELEKRLEGGPRAPAA